MTGGETASHLEKVASSATRYEDHKNNNATADNDLAQLANLEDQELGKFAAVRQYPLACFWCLYSVWCILLVSFENQAAGTVIGIPQFRKDFGSEYEGNYVLPSEWQAAFSGAPVASAIFGTLGSGLLADGLGRKMSIFVALLISFAAITVEFIATTNPVFFAGKFVNGLSIGVMASVTVTYIGEVTPHALRGLFTCLSALSYTLGPLVVAIIIDATGTLESRWAYRAVFCAQYGFAAIAAAGLWFMPESPWWYTMRGKRDKAMKSLRNLGHSEDHAQQKLALIERTLEESRRETSGVTYLECLKKNNLRRTIIAIMPMAIQMLSGVNFAASYSTYYIQLAGYSTAESFKLQIVQQVASLVGNVMSWYLVDWVGRRSLTLWGTVMLTVVLWLMGGLAVAATAGAIKGTVAMIIIYCWLYNATIGASAYTIMAEVPTSRLRAKTVAIGIAVQYTISLIWQFVLPYMFNPDKANMGAKVAFVFGGLAVLCIIYLWFYQPETAGRTYEELDEMFAQKVPARKFKSYKTSAQLDNERLTGDDDIKKSAK
ncbi:general substrate transporter [Biscogniauxia mediterranea]|nr:general substrate transporter [Biscogniauxia mediterranea]